MGNGTSIGRVRGLGAAKEGTHHWLLQRFTAIGNLVLVGWLAVSLLLLPNASYVSVLGWLTRPVPATALALLVVSAFWHARLGLQVVIEDYVGGANRFAMIVLLNLVMCAGAAFGVFCSVRLALGGA